MKFDQQYLKTLEKVYQLTKEGRTDEIAEDFSIPKMFGAWSSIFWALPQLDRFRDFEIEDLKKLIQSLIKSHSAYKSTTNQHLLTDTIDWIAKKLIIAANVYGVDPNEGLYAKNWINNLYENPNSEYKYTSEIGLSLKKKFDDETLIASQNEQKKSERLQKIERENEEKREHKQIEKRKNYFEYLKRNENQNDKRNAYLEEFSELSSLEKLKRIIYEEKPLFFFPLEIANVDIETLNQLTQSERITLSAKISKYRMKEWYGTNERIKAMK